MAYKSALLFASTALAIAVPHVDTAALEARQDKPIVWTKPDGTGQTQAVFGDGKVYIGACTPDQIFDSVAENCYTEGFCNSESWTLQCEEGDMTTHTITISAPEGQYQTWIHNGLIDSMRAGIKTGDLVQQDTITAESGGGCVGCSKCQY